MKNKKAKYTYEAKCVYPTQSFPRSHKAYAVSSIEEGRAKLERKGLIIFGEGKLLDKGEVVAVG